jgi:hypothetical protein
MGYVTFPGGIEHEALCFDLIFVGKETGKSIGQDEQNHP